MPQVNPQDGTTVLEDVVVTATRRLNGYRVEPPFPADDNSTGPVLPDTPEAPDPSGTLEEDCLKLAALNRAVLEAAERIGADDSEGGYLLLRLSNGGIQAIGPVPGGETNEEVAWRLNPSFYGLVDFSNVVGIVHNHPRNNAYPRDSLRTRFSEADAVVTRSFIAAGVDPNFQQFIVVNNLGYAFDQDSAEGDAGVRVESIQCPGASLS